MIILLNKLKKINLLNETYQKILPIIRKINDKTGNQIIYKPALHEIDSKLEKYLNFNEGIFVEAGANDGYKQSNTYFLEKYKNWNGVLIEPIPELYQKCLTERQNSIVLNNALVSKEYKHKDIKIFYSDLMSIVENDNFTKKDLNEHVKKGLEIQKIKKTYEVNVNVVTLTYIFDTYLAGKNIDFLSLDVEGYECNVLNGLDLKKYSPTYILIESQNLNNVKNILGFKYKLLDQFSYHDYFFGLK